MDQFSTATWDDLLNDRLIPRRRRDRDARAEVRKRIAKLKAECSCDRFPTDVCALAQAVGIREIRSVPLSIRGRIVSDNGGIVAELNEDLSFRAQRFVLAHEIAHILLARDLANTGARNVFGSVGSKKSHTFVENLCDFAAREVLLPENTVRKELKSRPVSLDFVTTLASEADCDVEVVAECICDLPGCREVLFLFCRAMASGLEVLRVVPNRSTAFELADSEHNLVRRTLRERMAITGTQELWANGNRTTVAAEAFSADSENAVLLIRSHGR
jgi:Zn-dependent peptidase ImmA (M78 family)